MKPSSPTSVRVWDPIVRIGHWATAAAFVIAYATEDERLDLHVTAGYVIGAILVVRIAWGFFGTEHARFASFAPTPSRVLTHLRELIAGQPTRHLGHNPAGGAMALLLMTTLGLTVLSGLVLYAEEYDSGPFAHISAPEAGLEPISPIRMARADGDRHETDGESESAMEEIHEAFANLSLALVFVHVGGVVASSLVERENLVKSMVTGRKRT